MYCVAIAFKMTEQVEWQICIKFCIKLEHSSTETIRMTQDATAMTNWWLAASSWQRSHSCIMSCAEFFGETSNHPSDSAPLQPCDFWLFPELKSPLKGKRFQTIDEIHKITMGQLMVTGRTVWGPKVPTLKGTEESLFYSQSYFDCTSHTVHMLTQWCLLPPLTSTVKLSLFMHVHSSPLSLAARLHQCHANHFRYINNGMAGLFPDRPHNNLDIIMNYYTLKI